METPMRRQVSWAQTFKFIIIGDAGVGKSCLTLQFTEHKFRPELDPTIGADCSTRTIDVDGKPTRLQIWDTTDQEPYRSMTKSYYGGAAAAILVYDVTRRETFDHVARWLEDAVEVAPPNLTTVLVGNKCDLSGRRAVGYEDGESFARAHGLVFMESSARTARNVEEAFIVAAAEVSRKIDDGVLDPSAKFAGSERFYFV